MKPFFLLCIACIVLGCSRMGGHAQLGETNFGGIRINAHMISFGGDTRDLDCHVSLELSGDKFANAIRLSHARVLQAVDDTGVDLVRHNGRRFGLSSMPPTRTSDGFIQTLDLRSPSAKANSIRNVAWEAELLAGASTVTTQTIRFQLETVRLPWFGPPVLQVTARRVSWYDHAQRDQRRCSMLLYFAGGPVQESAGIRNLWIQNAESDTGQQLKVPEDARHWMASFSPFDDSISRGRSICKAVSFEPPSQDVKAIRVLEGEAEMYFPSQANGGRVEFTNFLLHAGEPLLDPALSRNGIKLTFLDRENFETKRKESYPTRIRFVASVPPGMSEEVKDSLLFAVDDPEKRLVNLVFSDEGGATLPIRTQVIQTEFFSPHSNRFNLHTFETPPPPGTRLTAYVTTPESLRRVPFRAENIPLP